MNPRNLEPGARAEGAGAEAGAGADGAGAEAGAGAWLNPKNLEPVAGACCGWVWGPRPKPPAALKATWGSLGNVCKYLYEFVFE